MSKEMHPELFHPLAENRLKLDMESEKVLKTIQNLEAMNAHRFASKEDLRAVQDRVFETMSQYAEQMKTLLLRTDRLTQRLGQLEAKIESQTQEFRQKVTSLSTRVTERGLMETEIQSLIEKHNSVVRSFENRISQLQRLAESQQLQLMNSASTLDEARREMSRLRRASL